MMSPLTLLLGACVGSEPSSPTPDSPAGIDPALPEVEQPAPEVTIPPEAVAERITTALGYGFPDVFGMRAVFDGFFMAGDDVCPGPNTYMSDNTLIGCTSQSGWWYLGIGGYEIGEFEEDENYVLAVGSYGDMQVLGPAGEELAVGGHWIHRDEFRPGRIAWEGDISGSWSGALTAQGWLDEGFSGWLSYGGEHFEDAAEGADTSWVTGTMAEGDTDLAFEDLTFGGEGCEGYPSGAVKLRDPSGYWYKVDFGETCTGCGALSFGTEDLGQELCVDLRFLGGLLVDTGVP